MMKHLLLVCAVMLCLLPVGGWAEDETNPALYPIRENGLWGYMNQAGDVMIGPQWIQVFPFDGETALVSTKPVGKGANPYGDGVIDRSGQYLIAPQENVTVEAYSHAYLIRYYEKKEEGTVAYEGFFDKASGFCQPPLPEYGSVMLWSDDGSGPIAVENADGLTGYVDRKTGETAIPFIYTGDSDDVCFWKGYARPADDLTIVDADGQGIAMGAEMHLIDADGEEVKLPENMSVVSKVFDGCLIVLMPLPEEETERRQSIVEAAADEDEEEWFPDDDPGLSLPLYRVDPITGEKTEFDWRELYGEDDIAYGYALARLDGTVLYGPDPDISKMWEADEEGMICIISEETSLCGHMDLNGNVLVEPRYRIDFGGAVPHYSFHNGYAVVEDLGGDWPDTERFVILNAAGNEVFSRNTRLDDGTTFRLCNRVLENGLVWYEAAAGYGLIKITAQGSEDLSGAVYEKSLGCSRYEYGEGIEFSEGLHPVMQNGLWGYIDGHAEWVIQPLYDQADNFRDGLALVEKDGRLMYIDHNGTAVWEEQ